MASLAQESGFRTDALGDSGSARGIAQWHPDRQAAIEQQFGKRISTMSSQEQVAAVDWESRTREAAADAALGRVRSSAEAG